MYTTPMITSGSTIYSGFSRLLQGIDLNLQKMSSTLYVVFVYTLTLLIQGGGFVSPTSL